VLAEDAIKAAISDYRTKQAKRVPAEGVTSEQSVA
jgi:hypothetical protein